MQSSWHLTKLKPCIRVCVCVWQLQLSSQPTKRATNMLWHVTVHRMLHVAAQQTRSIVYKPKSNQIEVVAAAAAAAATVATNEV